MDIDKLIGNIPKYSEKELIALYNNAINNDRVSDVDKERVIAEIELQTRLRFPRSAKRLFGAKEKKARAILEAFYDAISEKFDFSNNVLKNGVKTGGCMLSGEYHVNLYMSYKNSENFGAAISLDQKTADSELLSEVRLYRTNCAEVGNIERREFSLDDFDAAKALYEKYLDQVVKV